MSIPAFASKATSPVRGTRTGEEGSEATKGCSTGAGNSSILDVTVPTDTTGYVVAFKQGVDGAGLCWPCSGALQVVARVVAKQGVPFVVTSVRDGVHAVGSLHHCGLAFDFRTREMPKAGLWRFANQVRADLAGFALVNQLPGRFDVVLEATHIHVEYDRRKRK